MSGSALPLLARDFLVACALTALAALTGLACAAEGAAPAAPQATGGAWVRLQWLDLRGASAAAAPYRRLWGDRLLPSQRAWRAAGAGQRSEPPSELPAYTLSQVLSGGILVTALFDLYDCELPGNGSGADLYARCPMRVIYKGASGSTFKHVDKACVLYVPTPSRPSEGPDPETNHTTARLIGALLVWEVIQGGRPVPSCHLQVHLP